MMETISLFGCSFQSSHFSLRGRCQLSYVSRMCFTLLLFITTPHKTKKFARTFGPHLINIARDVFWLESNQFKRFKLSSQCEISLSLCAEHNLPTGINKFTGTGKHKLFAIYHKIHGFLPSPKMMNEGLVSMALRTDDKPTYVVLVVSQHWSKGHKILCWRCCASTESWGIFRPQKGRQR